MSAKQDLKVILICLFLGWNVSPLAAQDNTQPVHKYSLGILVGLNQSHEKISNYTNGKQYTSQTDKLYDQEASLNAGLIYRFNKKG
jgi:hypothetical protein